MFADKKVDLKMFRNLSLQINFLEKLITSMQ